MRLEIPRGKLLYRQLRRAATVWVAIHTILALVTRGQVLALSFWPLAILCCVSGVLAAIDIRRRHETVFLANLGIRTSTAVILWMATVLALEAILSILVAAGVK